MRKKQAKSLNKRRINIPYSRLLKSFPLWVTLKLFSLPNKSVKRRHLNMSTCYLLKNTSEYDKQNIKLNFKIQD